AIDELAKLAQPLNAAEIEVDAQMHAALSVMPIKRATVAVLAHQRVQLAEIRAEMNGGNPRIVPALPAIRLSRNANRRAQRRFAHLPHAFRIFVVVDARPGS